MASCSPGFDDIKMNEAGSGLGMACDTLHKAILSARSGLSLDDEFDLNAGDLTKQFENLLKSKRLNELKEQADQARRNRSSSPAVQSRLQPPPQNPVPSRYSNMCADTSDADSSAARGKGRFLGWHADYPGFDDWIHHNSDQAAGEFLWVTGVVVRKRQFGFQAHLDHLFRTDFDSWLSSQKGRASQRSQFGRYYFDDNLDPIRLLQKQQKYQQSLLKVGRHDLSREDLQTKQINNKQALRRESSPYKCSSGCYTRKQPDCPARKIPASGYQQQTQHETKMNHQRSITSVDLCSDPENMYALQQPKDTINPFSWDLYRQSPAPCSNLEPLGPQTSDCSDRSSLFDQFTHLNDFDFDSDFLIFPEGSSTDLSTLEHEWMSPFWESESNTDGTSQNDLGIISSSDCPPPATRNTSKHYCEDCSQCFATKSELARHTRRHTKPFRCDNEGCTKSFAERRDRDRHSKSCGRKAVSPSSQSEEGRGHQCHICSFAAWRPDSVQRHIRTRHRAKKCRPAPVVLFPKPT